MQPLFCLRGLRWCSCHVCLVAVSCSERAWGWVWLGRGWTGISFFLFLMWLNNPITSALSSLSCHFLSYPLLCSSILPSFGFIISISSPVLLSSFSFPLPSLSVYLSSPHPSAHIPPAFSSQSALKYMCVCACGFHLSVHSGLALGAVCEAICASVRVLWAQHAAAQGARDWVTRGGMQFERVKSV